jgi:3D-(3,5/4)-trihydroxycyclohexane-1,2-dione acylhydrolase (decyclizing)
MAKTVRLTMSQAIATFLANQMTEIDGRKLPIFGGVWAIFGHGNVAGMGEALYQVRDRLPTFRGQNEQSMAHAATAYAKASFRRRMMACTTSIGPGATNMVTAAAVAHVNRLPVLFLPGDVFANRLPDPVLQQVEDFGDGTVSANDCFRPVSRYFDRMTRPEQIIPALERAMQVLTDPAACGPVTLALCQDVQAEAYDYPEAFLAERLWVPRRPEPDRRELAAAVAALKGAKKPVIIAGGGVLYSGASEALRTFAETHGVPVMETQAGKSSLRHDHALNMGAVGVTGSSASNGLAREADVVLAVGTRLQDFTTGSWALFQGAGVKIVALNAQPFDAGKHGALPLVAEAKAGIETLAKELAGWKSPAAWLEKARGGKAAWLKDAADVTRATNAVPSDAQVIGAVQRVFGEDAILVCASGGLPGELHKLWQAGGPGTYHLEYGYSCMGYEIAGGLGVKMADPSREVFVMVGDGSYLMMAQEIVTAVQEGIKLIIVLVDSQGFASIGSLSRSVGSGGFGTNYRFRSPKTGALDGDMLPVDLAANAESLGAEVFRASDRDSHERALGQALAAARTSVVYVPVDPLARVPGHGCWWDVPVAEVSEQPSVRAARAEYEEARQKQRWFGC